jgi:hypothetical protein
MNADERGLTGAERGAVESTTKLTSQVRHEMVAPSQDLRLREPWSRNTQNQLAAKGRKDRKEPVGWGILASGNLTADDADERRLYPTAKLKTESRN